MNNKKIIIIIISVFLIITTILLNFLNENKTYSYVLNSNDLSVMIYDETEDNYKKQNSIPTGSYELNEELSYCEAGGVIQSYDNSLGKVVTIINGADKCYFYFDKIKSKIINITPDVVGTTIRKSNITLNTGELHHFYISWDNQNTYHKYNGCYFFEPCSDLPVDSNNVTVYVYGITKDHQKTNIYEVNGLSGKPSGTVCETSERCTKYESETDYNSENVTDDIFSFSLIESYFDSSSDIGSLVDYIANNYDSSPYNYLNNSETISDSNGYIETYDGEYYFDNNNFNELLDEYEGNYRMYQLDLFGYNTSFGYLSFEKNINYFEDYGWNNADLIGIVFIVDDDYNIDYIYGIETSLISDNMYEITIPEEVAEEINEKKAFLFPIPHI